MRATEGWFHSGDGAVMHPDGYVEIRDRLKDVIISGGENISSVEVEQVIVRHPSVLEAAVIGIPDDHWGERPKAFVTLVDGASVDDATLIAFCREQLAHFKCPDSIEFIGAAEDLDRQGPEDGAARARVGRSRPARQLATRLDLHVERHLEQLDRGAASHAAGDRRLHRAQRRVALLADPPRSRRA